MMKSEGLSSPDFTQERSILIQLASKIHVDCTNVTNLLNNISNHLRSVLVSIQERTKGIIQNLELKVANLVKKNEEGCTRFIQRETQAFLMKSTEQCNEMITSLQQYQAALQMVDDLKPRKVVQRGLPKQAPAKQMDLSNYQPCEVSVN
jgi:hypothetical protein